MGATAPSAGVGGERKVFRSKGNGAGVANLQEVWIGAAGTQSLRNVRIGKEWGAVRKDSMERSNSRLKVVRKG